MDVRVLTLNVWNTEGDAARRMTLINEELRRLSPDLLVLQEVMPGQVEGLLEGTGLHCTHQADVEAVPTPLSERYGGNAVASRWPHRVVEAVDLGSPDVPWLTLAARVELPEAGEMLLVAMTTAWRPDAAADRERQVLRVAELEARHRGPVPSILAGDLTAGPDSSATRFLTGRHALDGRSVFFRDVWEVAGKGPGVTWTADNPAAAGVMAQLIGRPGIHERIDYVFVGAGWQIRTASTVLDEPVDGVWASDHFGVMADLS